jgi:hypothetical protein
MPPARCFADFRLTSWKVCWNSAITEGLSPMSNPRKRLNYSGEEKVAFLRAHFVGGLLQEHVQLQKAVQRQIVCAGWEKGIWGGQKVVIAI